MSQKSKDDAPVEEVMLDVEDLDEVEIVDEVAADPAARRRLRWTPGLGVSTGVGTRMGVMLPKRGRS